MMGPSHRITGVVAWLALAPTLHQAQWQHLLVGGLVAGACAHGRLSPDIDQYMGWPHRHFTHFWLWPVLFFVAGHTFAPAATYLGVGEPWLATVLYAEAVAYGSHIATDGIFGRIPIWPRLRWRQPRWRYAGLGLKTGGHIEKWLAVPAMVAAGGYLIWGMA